MIEWLSIIASTALLTLGAAMVMLAGLVRDMRVRKDEWREMPPRLMRSSYDTVQMPHLDVF